MNCKIFKNYVKNSFQDLRKMNVFLLFVKVSQKLILSELTIYFLPVTFSWNLPHDGNNRTVPQHHDSVDLTLHHVHGTFRNQASALDLLPCIPQPLNKPGLGVLHLNKLNISITLPSKEDHVSVGVEQGNQDTGGHVQGQDKLRGGEVPSISKDELTGPVLSEPGG